MNTRDTPSDRPRAGSLHALVILHLAFEDLGSLRPVLTAAGFFLDIVEASTVDWRALSATAPDLVVVMGGPIGVYERSAYPFLDTELGFLRARLAAERPTIGICLGAQLMAGALGASVHPGTQGKEIGWGALEPGVAAAEFPELRRLLSPEVRVLHWHGDTFDLPPHAKHLAATAQYTNQAFALGNYGLAVQFHPEVTAAGLERWYVGHACELSQARVDVNALRAQSRRWAPALELAAAPFWREWLERAFGNAMR
jgi:GMP synthase (glutamine-hydrolysing)